MDRNDLQNKKEVSYNKLTLQEAYKIVYEDIKNKDIYLFQGIYDARNGSDKFMHGINTVMEFIIANAYDKDEKKINEECSNFINNMIQSQKQASINNN